MFSRRAVVLAIVVSAVISLRAAAQERVPKYEFGLGISIANTHSVPGSSDMFQMNGIQFDTTYNLNRWLGLTGEFTGHYRCAVGCVWDASVARHKAFTFVAGPRLSVPRNRRYIPYVHALAGVSNISYSNDFGVDLPTTGWALVAGGGLDVPYKSVIVRPIQIDLFHHEVGSTRYNDMKFGFGVAIGWGRARGKR